MDFLLYEVSVQRGDAHSDQPRLRVEVVIDIALDGTRLVARLADIRWGVIAGMIGPEHQDLVSQRVSEAFGAGFGVDLAGAFADFGLGAVAESSVTRSGGRVWFRFGAGKPVGDLDFPKTWAVFIDGEAAAGIVRSFIPSSLPRMPSPSIETGWTMAGANSIVRARITGKLDVPDPATATAKAELFCRFSLSETSPRQLLADVAYELSVTTGGVTGALATIDDIATFFGLFPSPLHDIAEDVMRDLLNTFVEPTAFGATRTGSNSFRISRPLPPIAFGDAALHAEAVTTSKEGFTIAGQVGMPGDWSSIRLDADVEPFSGSLQAVTFCSLNESVDETPLPGLFRSGASVTYQHGGRLCGFDVLSPGPEVLQHMTFPPADIHGAQPGNGRIFVVLGAKESDAIAAPVAGILRTSRGVRYIDFGSPLTLTVGPDGLVVGGSVLHIDDCLHQPVVPIEGMSVEEYERWTGLIWYTYWGLVPGRDYDPENPPIIPADIESVLTSPTEWESFVNEIDYVTTQLIEVAGGDPGEQFVVRTGRHSIDITAGADGTARIPVILGGRLGRRELVSPYIASVQRRSLVDRIAVRSVVFEPVATVQGALVERATVDDLGNAVLERSAGENAVFTIADAVVEGAAVAVRNVAASRRVFDVSFPGVVQVQAFPGFEDEPVALARTNSGATLIVDVSGAEPRIAGELRGPIDALVADGSWGFRQAESGVDLFRARRAVV